MDSKKCVQKGPFFVDLLPDGSCHVEGKPSVQSDVHLAASLCAKCCNNCCCQHACYGQVASVRSEFFSLNQKEGKDYLIEVVQKAIKRDGCFVWEADGFAPMPICEVGYCLLLGVSTKTVASLKRKLLEHDPAVGVDFRYSTHRAPQQEAVMHFFDAYLIPNASSPHVGSKRSTCSMNNKQFVYVTEGGIKYWYDKFVAYCLKFNISKDRIPSL